jgi:hypothetical protein
VLEATRELARQVINNSLSIKSSLLLIAPLYGGKAYSRNVIYYPDQMKLFQFHRILFNFSLKEFSIRVYSFINNS